MDWGVVDLQDQGEGQGLGSESQKKIPRRCGCALLGPSKVLLQVLEGSRLMGSSLISSLSVLAALEFHPSVRNGIPCPHVKFSVH